jgi:uncharacterized membrane protein YphA (DoxX/SURF4 family)
MNILLWVLQVLAALLYGASGVMKVFLFEKVSEGVPSFGAMPRGAWTVLGVVELVCSAGLVAPGALHWEPMVTVVAAAVLAVESLVFVRVHLKYKEAVPIVMSAVLGLVMAFLVYGRMVLRPL